MSQMTENVCELLPCRPCDLYGPRPDPGDSRTALIRYFLDPVLPVLTLLSMSALTVVLLFVLVTTVADMDLQPGGGYESIDPWSGISRSVSGGYYLEPGTYTDRAMPLDPRDDGESWSALASSDRF